MLNPIDIDHETRETFIDEMTEELLYELPGEWGPQRASDVAWKFHEELWQISWELEAYYRRYVMGYDAGAQVEP